MANTTIYPYGTNGQLPSSIGLVNDLKQGGVNKALTAEQGKVIGMVLYGLAEPEVTSPTMKQGVYNAYTGIYASSSTRICTSVGVRVMGAFKVEVASGYKYNILYYDVNQTFIEAESDVWLTEPTEKEYFDGHIQINVAKADDSAITTTATTGLEVTLYASEGGIVDNVASLMADVYGEGSGEETTTSMALEQGGMLPDGTKQTDTQLTRARTIAPIRVYGDFTIALNTGYQMNVFFYSSADLSSFERSLDAWVDTPYVGNHYGYIMIGVKASNNGNVTPSAVGATLTQAVYVPGIKDKVEGLVFDPNGYYYGADFMKHPLRVKSIGTLSYLQAFCVYNGNYYSTNGSNIAEQDENFAQLRSATISVGHGNSLQLGHNGKAYASGWDDQKVYVIDLVNLSVEATITLPTTGYTTAAIDDIRGYAYIFQRDSYPTSVATYNFIVYDYVNQQVISSRLLDEPFSAMQSCDYVDGKIIVAYGGGTTALPSGVRTYNTSGDVLAVYSINAIATVEPEGVAFDRDDWRLLLSDVNKNVMQIYV